MFILDSNVTFNIISNKSKKKTAKFAEEKNKNHTEEISIDNNKKTITDVDEDSDSTNCLTSDSDDNDSIFCEKEDAIDDDEVSKIKSLRKITHVSKKSPKREPPSIKKSKSTKVKHANKKLCQQPTKSNKPHHMKSGTRKAFLSCTNQFLSGIKKRSCS